MRPVQICKINMFVLLYKQPYSKYSFHVGIVSYSVIVTRKYSCKNQNRCDLALDFGVTNSSDESAIGVESFLT